MTHISSGTTVGLVPPGPTQECWARSNKYSDHDLKEKLATDFVTRQLGRINLVNERTVAF